MEFEVRQSSIYRDWFDRLRDREAKARIDVRVRRLSMGNKRTQRADIGRAIDIAKHWAE